LAGQRQPVSDSRAQVKTPRESTKAGRRLRWLEVGCGAGEVLIALASEHPENDYLGLDVYRPGLGRLLHGLAERKLENVRILCGDSPSLIDRQVSDQSLAGVYVFFPDPWPKNGIINAV